MWIISGCLSQCLRRCDTSSLDELEWRLILELCMWVCGKEQLHVYKEKDRDRPLFDEHFLVKNYVPESEKRKMWQNITISLEQQWATSFKLLLTKTQPFQTFKNLSSLYFVFCSPGTSAPVERIFSIMKNMWLDDRNIMLEQNVKTFLISKTYFSQCCVWRFYKKVKSITVFLKKVLGTEKHHCFVNKHNSFFCCI